MAAPGVGHHGGLVIASLSVMHAPLHAPSNQSAIFHFFTPLTDMCAPLHDPSDWSAVLHFVTPMTDMRTPLHTSSDWSAVFHFVYPLKDICASLHAPSGLTASMVQAWVGQKLVNVTFYEFLRCPFFALGP